MRGLASHCLSSADSPDPGICMATFYGEYDRSIDAKGRVILPVEIREQLAEDGDGPIWLTIWPDKCLYLHSQKGWDRVSERIRKRKSFKNQEFVRKFYSSTKKLDPDKQGRINIPQKLLAEAEVKKDLVFAGVLDHVEIWSKERWDLSNRQIEEEGTYKMLAEELFGPEGDDSGE